MIILDCSGVRDLLPERILGVLPPELATPMEEHLSNCSECSREESLLRTVFTSRPEVPPTLAPRIQSRLREEMAMGHRPEAVRRPASILSGFSLRPRAPAWVLSAAAVAVLSLGIAVVWNGEDLPEVGQDPVQVKTEEPIPESWLWDDGIVAGAPVLDGFSDQELEALIKELEG
jgi:anti-sigma factor RsiW